MCFNTKRVIRTTGTALVAFFSALLGYFFTISFSKETILHFIIIVLIILVGGALSSYE